MKTSPEGCCSTSQIKKVNRSRKFKRRTISDSMLKPHKRNVAKCMAK